MTCRILHVVGRMQRGGIQAWLMHLLRAIDHQRYRMDFLVHCAEACAHDREILQLGSRILRCAEPRNPWQYARAFRQALATGERYDIIHGHVYSLNGLVLKLAARLGVPSRIAHSHDDRRVVEAGGGTLRRYKLRLMKSWIRRHANLKIAASEDAAADLFGPEWQTDPSVCVIHCGIDLAPFAVVPETNLRTGLGLPPDALVIGHVGRFALQKNHGFLLEVAAEAIRLEPRVRLLLIGGGPLRQEIERRAQALGIGARVVFAGERDDVASIMATAMDVFVFPSVHEGLGLVLIEAQAAGLPCLIADRVPREADVVPGLISRLPIERSAALWAQRLLAIATAPRSVGQAEALAAVRRSTFEIARSVQQITRVYDGLL